tara:strand:+ start:6065 stop:6244 length:180 start_codon:yes stop_codon:yes gene_type:complete
MGVKNYGGALKVSDINRKIETPLDKVLPFKCPIGHINYQDTCASCRTIYETYRRSYNAK